ncbi:MAG: YchJ family metal-binding protein [Flavobacterium sp.]
MIKENCFCGSQITFQECCEPYIKGIRKAPTAETLMRSRYSAYATHAVDYLVATTEVSKRKYHSPKEMLNWATKNQWLKLEILNASENTVEFKAYFLDDTLEPQIHYEKSTFKFENGSWFYTDGKFY